MYVNYLEQYQTDMRIANFVYRKYFSSWTTIKDDLIQLAIIELWQHHHNYDNEKGQYTSWAHTIAKRVMIRAITRNKVIISENLSLDSFAFNDSESKATLGDFIGFYDIYSLDYMYLTQKIKQTYLQLKTNKQKAIVLQFLKGKTIGELIKIFNCSKQYISQVLLKYKQNLKSILQKEQYLYD